MQCCDALLEPGAVRAARPVLRGAPSLRGAGPTRHPAHRRRGHARAVTAALVEAFGARGCGSVELRATEAGAPLYRTLGFGPVDGYMRLNLGPGH
ncbi:GNAT family N-acetyltransferase [Kitasatospora sp. NPDC097605]|uniref:GNAT family N-acetyltransferase n=1 Tax=Kitasatospora sp. NPDC097605 TaxID=3157226 RepID=UPI003316E2B1